MLKPRHGLVAAFSCLVFVAATAAPAQTIESSDSGTHPSIIPAADTSSAVDDLSASVIVSLPDPAIPGEGDEATFDPSVIDVPDNQKVQHYVDLFTTSRKKFLEDALARGSRYLPMIQEIFKAEGLPEDLIYLPLIESAFRTSALSHAGATGIWQFMRGTATFNGLSRDWYVDERMDPEKSTRAAARLLKTLYGMFGDWPLALAAYNAGSGRVQQAMKRSKGDSYWEILAAGTRYLPRETREYVPLFLGALVVARDPLSYGIEISVLEQPLFDVVALNGPLDLRRVANWVGTSVEAIKELNPELRRWTTPARAEQYLLKVPAGTGAAVESRLAEGTPADLSRHVVKKGETLLGLSRKLNVTRTDLAEANYLKTTAKLRAGDTLIVPRAPDALKPDATATLATATPSGSAWGILSAPGLSKLVHMVRPGDTLDSIARAYRTSTTALKEWNGIVADSILPGQELMIFAPK